MPNHVTTRCTVTGPSDTVMAFRDRMIREEKDAKGEPFTVFDFNQIIPMPESVGAVDEIGYVPDVLVILCGGSHIHEVWERLRSSDKEGILGPWKGLLSYEDGEIEQRLEKWRPGCIKQARAMALSLGETGFRSWYYWCRAKWGTKWGAYSFSLVDEEPLQFVFDTAWNFPTPVFEALAREYPTLQFECLTFDEGWNFAGRGSFNGSPEFELCKATDELFEAVYGRKPDREEE